MSYASPDVNERLSDVFDALSEFVVRWIPMGIMILAWALVSGRVVATAVLPSPWTVFVHLQGLLVTPTFYLNLVVSFVRVALGLGIAVAIGTALGLFMARSDPVENFFDVLLTVSYPIPKSALVPIAILWLGSGTQTVVLVIFLGTLLPIVLNSYNAAGDVDENLVRAARMVGFDDREILKQVVFPASIPQILTGVRQAIPIGFIVLINAEMLAADIGIGSLVLRYGNLGVYNSMFAVIIAFSAVVYWIIRGFERYRRRVLAWH